MKTEFEGIVVLFIHNVILRSSFDFLPWSHGQFTLYHKFSVITISALIWENFGLILYSAVHKDLIPCSLFFPQMNEIDRYHWNLARVFYAVSSIFAVIGIISNSIIFLITAKTRFDASVISVSLNLQMFTFNVQFVDRSLLDCWYSSSSKFAKKTMKKLNFVVGSPCEDSYGIRCSTWDWERLVYCTYGKFMWFQTRATNIFIVLSSTGSWSWMH